jgi:hypothetical protein
MDRFRFALTTCAAICATALAAAQQPPAAAPVDRAAQERQAAELNARPDTPGSGRFAAIKEEVPSLPRHVVYRPWVWWPGATAGVPTMAQAAGSICWRLPLTGIS